MKFKSIAVATLTLSMLSGCATQSLLLRPSQNANPTAEKAQTFYISGLGQQRVMNAAEVCNGQANVARVESVQTPRDILLSLVTLGIYTPRTAKVYCQR